MKGQKKLILFILQIVLVISFAACHGREGGGETPNTTTSEVPAIDLTGSWGTNVLSSGSGEPRWERGTLSVYADNITSYSAFAADGTSLNSSGTITINENRTITLAGPGSIDVYPDAGGTVMHGVTWSDSSQAAIYTALKKADSYSAGDVEGAWKANILVSGSSSYGWERSAANVDSLGNFSASTVDINGGARYLTSGGSLKVSANGLVTMAAKSTLEGVMDSNKTVMIWTDTLSGGATELAVLTRKAASYSEADLVGNWKFSTISAGEASSAARGTMSVSSGGSAVIEYENAKGSGVNQRKLLISPDGTVTIEGFPYAEGAMDSDKTVMVFTETLITLDVPSGSDIIIFTKQ